MLHKMICVSIGLVGAAFLAIIIYSHLKGSDVVTYPGKNHSPVEWYQGAGIACFLIFMAFYLFRAGTKKS